MNPLTETETEINGKRKLNGNENMKNGNENKTELSYMEFQLNKTLLKLH